MVIVKPQSKSKDPPLTSPPVAGVRRDGLSWEYSSPEGNMQHSVSERRARKSEGMDTNCRNAVLGAWLDVRSYPGRLLRKLGSKVAPSHRPVAFTLESLPLDACHGE